jgi:hypothetical protein
MGMSYRRRAMKIRGVVVKAVIVAILAGGGMAVTAAPASAERNDDGCSEVWAGVAEAQAGMEGATTQQEFWTWFRAWQTWLDVASGYC